MTSTGSSGGPVGPNPNINWGNPDASNGPQSGFFNQETPPAELTRFAGNKQNLCDVGSGLPVGQQPESTFNPQPPKMTPEQWNTVFNNLDPSNLGSSTTQGLLSARFAEAGQIDADSDFDDESDLTRGWPSDTQNLDSSLRSLFANV